MRDRETGATAARDLTAHPQQRRDFNIGVPSRSKKKQKPCLEGKCIAVGIRWPLRTQTLRTDPPIAGLTRGERTASRAVQASIRMAVRGSCLTTAVLICAVAAYIGPRVVGESSSCSYLSLRRTKNGIRPGLAHLHPTDSPSLASRLHGIYPEGPL